jgi:AraC-like DNA-binding protein
MRHDERRSGFCISTWAHDFPAASLIPEHAHASDQLIYASSGVMEVTLSQTRVLVPPLFAVWVAADTRHSIRMPCDVSMRTLYLRPRLVRARNCRVLHVAPLLRELILEANRIGGLLTRKRSHAALRDVIVAQIAKSAPIPTALTLPSDPRAKRLAEATLADPTAKRKLDDRCRALGMSVRTLQRLFRRELGMNYESWRRQVRLLKAIELLATGARIKAASAAVGYRQTSSFIAVFSRHFGLTPRAWITVNSPAWRG